MDRDRLAAHRDFLKDSLRLQIDFGATAQNRGVPPPPLQKPPRPEQQPLALPGPESFTAFAGTELVAALLRRRSHRRFSSEPLGLTELALLLYATQGVVEPLGAGHARRTVPSAGCRHAFESYLLVSNVTGLAAGVYRYLPLEHALVLEQPQPVPAAALSEATLGQGFIASAPVSFVWTVLPERMEWRYGLAAHRVLLLDAGHLCQNLYLACEAIGAGTCAIAAYHQARMDALLQLDGNEEFTLYLAPVGKLP